MYFFDQNINQKCVGQNTSCREKKKEETEKERLSSLGQYELRSASKDSIIVSHIIFMYEGEYFPGLVIEMRRFEHNISAMAKIAWSN